MAFTRSLEVSKGVFVDRVEPGKEPRGFGGERPQVTAVRDGEHIRLSTGQVLHTAGPLVAYWVEAL